LASENDPNTSKVLDGKGMLLLRSTYKDIVLWDFEFARQVVYHFRTKAPLSNDQVHCYFRENLPKEFETLAYLRLLILFRRIM